AGINDYSVSGKPAATDSTVAAGLIDLTPVRLKNPASAGFFCFKSDEFTQGMLNRVDIVFTEA
ncbi:hypothetical protein, partial [Oceanospirillum linum]|uniref:hypothetical protein n=1 Tax=Oceanospirillum linum TaxID=966 RepID=UPI0024B8AA54